MSATVLLQDGKGPCRGGGETTAGLRHRRTDGLDRRPGSCRRYPAGESPARSRLAAIAAPSRGRPRGRSHGHHDADLLAQFDVPERIDLVHLLDELVGEIDALA